MKKLATIGFFLVLLIGNSCRTKDITGEAKFEHSSYFKYIHGLCSSDTACAYSTIQTTLSEINETGFIHSEGYEYYIIGYTHGLLLENRAFVIKKDKLGTHITFKTGTSKHGRNISIEKCNEGISTLFKSKEVSATLDSDTAFIAIKNEIEKLLNKTKPINQDVINDASSEIFYFNGKDYYSLSYYNLEIEDYYMVSQLIYSIKNTNPFLCLRSADPNYRQDTQDSAFYFKYKEVFK